jgi:hypothetical protein
MDNTEGYTQEQLDALNAEWQERAKSEGLEPGTDEYKEMEKAFSDEVARR